MTHAFKSNLVEELRNKLSKKILWSVTLLSTIGSILHVAWSFQQKNSQENRLVQAVAYTNQEAVRNYDLISLKRSIHAFELSNPGAIICLELDNNDIISNGSCNSIFKKINIPLSNKSFNVSVSLPIITPMTLAGIPFILLSALLLIYIFTTLTRISKRLTSDIIQLSSKHELNNLIYNFSELSAASVKIHEGIESKIAFEKAKNEAVIGRLSSQVCHDIRSPLAALEMILPTIDVLPEDKRLIMRSAIGRIRDIANSLLTNSKKQLSQTIASSDIQKMETQIYYLAPVLDSILTEKRIQYRDHLKVIIEFDCTLDTYALFADVNSVELKRIISNLINNSVEALPKLSGKILLNLSSHIDGRLKIEICDNGKGIPELELPKLTHIGSSFNKEGGTGLGLHHAKTTLNQWGGELSIHSNVSANTHGTVVTLYLPAAHPPAWFIPKLKISTNQQIVVFDDDQSIHQIWDRRFRTTLSHVKLNHISTINDLKKFFNVHFLELDNALFLIDYEILGQNQSGLELIEELGIQRQSILVTSHHEELTVLNKCNQLGVKLIPKLMCGFIPIEVQES
jgi:signal transduction histidine kinase